MAMLLDTVIRAPANPANVGGARQPGEIRFIVVHYTGNDGDRAESNARYFRDHVVKASAHYFVDDKEIYQSVDDLQVAYSVGGRKYKDCATSGGGRLYGIACNANTLNVEMCDTIADGRLMATEATMARAAQLVRELMERYHIPVERVIRHFDVTGKRCPAYFVEEKAWAGFKARLTEERWEPTWMQAGPAYREGVRWAVEQGILRGNGQGDLMLQEPVTREQMCLMMYRAMGGKD